MPHEGNKENKTEKEGRRTYWRRNKRIEDWKVPTRIVGNKGLYYVGFELDTLD